MDSKIKIVILVCVLVLAAVIDETGHAEEGDAGKAPMALWTFEEPVEALQFHGAPDKTVWTARTDQAIVRRGGVRGHALDLRGNHAIWAGAFDRSRMSALSIMVWVRPLDLTGFREIFRQESDDRVLFSFQDSGNILSLGLNVNGYVECDARIAPKQILDGTWHHCAGTFDGHTMRVFLDGKEIGALERPGSIALSPGLPAFIGSMGGTNEHFQGGLDELRLYDVALGAEEIMGLFRQGLASISENSKRLDIAAGKLYVEAPSFSETVANTRKNLRMRGPAADPDLTDALEARLRTAFPDECAAFFEWTGTTAGALLSQDESLNEAQARRLIELMLEYKPLTEYQKQKQSPEDRAKWDEAERIRDRFERLTAQGEPAQSSPEWFDLMFDAGRRIAFRPRVYEPVAPYVKPETPETRNLTEDEARVAIESDWMHQADQNPTPERIRDEIRWAREMAAHIQVDVSEPLARLDMLAEKIPGKAATELCDLYLAVRMAKREIMFKNPVLDFSRLLLVDMPYPQGSEWQHETRHRLGYMAVPGARLLILDGLHPAGNVTQLMPQPPLHGSFWRPDVSFDGKKVLFCFKPHNEKSFHIYEINCDGSGLVQLTDGVYDDVDPIYLPDGHIMFATTRGHNYVRCMPPTNSFQLARADADGGNIYLVSYSNEPDYLPSVMDDGRVVYTRWEYTDKPLWRAQKLWTTHPDGTQVATFWGNQSVWPDVMKDARNIPGSRRVMFTGSAHHDWFAGSVGIIDPDKGLNFPNGLTKVTADVEWPECYNGPVDPVESPSYHVSGKYPAYYSPYPLSERDFLVSAQRDGKFRLYLMDVDGNRELIYEGVHNIFHAMPLKPRAKPHEIVDRVAWPSRGERDNPAPGVLFSNDVYKNAPEELRGKARYLRIWQIDAKTYTYWHKRPYISTGPVVSAVQSEGVKRLIGTVPVESDGSVSFTAPSGQALHFQLLDGHFRALQTMRSFVGVMPGESRGCLGCHESHSRAPGLGEKSIAGSAPPRAIEPPPWPDTTVSYARYVRPVLDRYCSRCHEGDGEGRKTFDMTERPSPPVFSEPYMTLIGRPTWGAPYTPPEKPVPGFGIAGVLMVEAFDQRDPKAYVTPKPMTSLSYRSPLIEMVSSGKHHGVVVDETSRQRLIAWVDAMCPYLGDEEVRAIPDPEFQGVDWLAIRPRIATAPVVVRPGPVDEDAKPPA
ncbi:MAG TPA: hypothetical protein P5318_10045 [Candidatus Hydrogenedentes bacterium]|nr:hypothetical protein [Candidatus Hydrogenedentota bacterium]HRT20456.1 hypothetical protein [Candidatus Hydrogenedentota bacterium]HRT65209.1 hypothetical protein [Candidatus Hydrogenedentota bacterium]